VAAPWPRGGAKVNSKETVIAVHARPRSAAP
jgi:hypothetical protein